jgi:hypothetical protein
MLHRGAKGRVFSKLKQVARILTTLLSMFNLILSGILFAQETTNPFAPQVWLSSLTQHQSAFRPHSLVWRYCGPHPGKQPPKFRRALLLLHCASRLCHRAASRRCRTLQGYTGPEKECSPSTVRLGFLTRQCAVPKTQRDRTASV